MLEDDDPVNRGSAATALRRFEDPRAVEPLIRMLEDDDPVNRGIAASALRRFEDPKAVEPLIRLLEHQDPKSRGAAAKALGRLEDPRAIEALVRMLEDDSTYVRERATAALGRIGLDREEFFPLNGKLEDLSLSALSRIVNGALRSAFATNDLISARRLLRDLSKNVGFADWLWQPYEIALGYLAKGDPAILKSQHAEMREAVQLVLDLVPDRPDQASPVPDNSPWTRGT